MHPVGGVIGGVTSALGQKADIGLALIDVRFTPKSGHQAFMSTRPRCVPSWVGAGGVEHTEINRPRPSPG